MDIAPFPYAHPLGNASPQTGLIEPPAPEIGNVVWGYSTLPRSGNVRPWWHPLKNPYVTAGFMAVAALFALGALHEGAGVAVGVLLVGYLFAKGVGAIIGRAGRTTNFFVGEHGMDDVWKSSGGTGRRTFLWKDIAWWGTTPERSITTGLTSLRHVQLDSQMRLMDHVQPFAFRFAGDPNGDPESAMYASAQRAWLASKVAEVSRRLANGETVDMPIMFTQNAGRLVTGVRPASCVRVTADQIGVFVDGRVIFQAARRDTVLRWEHRPSPALRNSTDVHCVLLAPTGSWSAPRYEFPGAEVLTQFVRVEG